ncbi:MAG TPA: hypothetical protein VLX92_08860 [Kofleriaceae bacterium]|nr:hypothetical protein [Kofleriaceae bacterium]
MRWLAVMALCGCSDGSGFALAGDDQSEREVEQTIVSAHGRRAELAYVQGGGAAGYVFYEVDVDGRAIARSRQRPVVEWLGDSGILLRGCFDAYDRTWLDGDIAQDVRRGMAVAYQRCR